MSQAGERDISRGARRLAHKAPVMQAKSAWVVLGMAFEARLKNPNFT